MRLEMKRMAPGEMNTWFLEVLGTEGGVRFSTKDPKTLWVFERGREQIWQRIDLGYQVPFATITGGIFEPGFPDCFLQMWAAYAAERARPLGGRFGCPPGRGAAQPWMFAAALESHAKDRRPPQVTSPALKNLPGQASRPVPARFIAPVTCASWNSSLTSRRVPNRNAPTLA